MHFNVAEVRVLSSLEAGLYAMYIVASSLGDSNAND